MRVIFDVMRRLTSNYDNEKKNVTFMRSLHANIIKSNYNYYLFLTLKDNAFLMLKNLGWGDNIIRVSNGVHVVKMYCSRSQSSHHMVN